jgi:hypothetical protein
MTTTIDAVIPRGVDGRRNGRPRTTTTMGRVLPRQWGRVLLDIDKWLGLFSFTVKLVSKIMSAFCAHTINGHANGGKLPLAAIPAFSNDC